jgi:hypothetical protein
VIDLLRFDNRVDRLLACISSDAALGARFLNTLSLMEHIGSRKIMISQTRGGVLNAETLQHLAEESRHAFFFKRAAEAMAGRALGYDDVDCLAPAQARAYMARLDAKIARSTAGKTAYLAMSYIVEVRAVWFYKLYEAALKAAGRPLRLAGLLAEEKNHLADMRAQLDGAGMDAPLAAFSAYENSLFAGLLAALERACGIFDTTADPGAQGAIFLPEQVQHL